MSNADEKSKQYRDFREQCGIKDHVMLNEIEEAYYEGYQQAEEDLELGWEDILSILKIHVEVYEDETLGHQNKQEVCQEVLKRFKERKKK